MQIPLVDGTYELFRTYYGAPPKTARDGSEVGATVALGRTLLGLLLSEGATHVGVAFDHVVESFRNELFAGYKTGEGIDPDLFGQFEPAERMTRALGLGVWSMDEEGVREKSGVPPVSIPDWLALVGDAADGIPGVPRWGARSAAAALVAHGHIDNIPEDPRDWKFQARGAASLAENLRSHRDEPG